MYLDTLSMFHFGRISDMDQIYWPRRGNLP